MLTRWGRDLDRAHPLPEHPRPQLQRDGWRCLNGIWQHAFTDDDQAPAQYDGPIAVPFSPETRLSGVGRQLQPDERLWYRRDLEVAPPTDGGRVLLHFGAVDQRCTVWVDGTRVGGHVGGYLPFTLDVTDALAEGRRHELVVRVRDVSETGWHARGKQRLDRGEIWYTAQSGIWQTVWLEVVPAAYVADLALVPDLEHDLLLVTVEPGGDPAVLPPLATVVVRAGDTELVRADVPVGTPAPLALPGARRWSPEDPFLHDVEVTYGEDHVTSYAGMRSIGVGTDADGHRRLLLNGAPYPHVGLLDQGYWPESLLTPPTDAAIVSELELVRSLGFTVLRKHAKVEPLRWYHHCDRLGLLVWQDVVNGGERYHPRAVHRAETERRLPDRLRRVYGRTSRRGRREFLGEVDATVRLLRSAPSVVVWTPFNEGWGQFDANRVARRMSRLDPTRLVLQASGWVDQGGGDLRGYHSYLRHFTMPRRRRGRAGQRPVVLSEYGGYALHLTDHAWSPRQFGYRGFGSAEELTEALVELHDAMRTEAAAGLAATVYTQLTDVEDEVNGLLTWDREVLKVPAERLREITASLRAAMAGSPDRVT